MTATAPNPWGPLDEWHGYTADGWLLSGTTADPNGCNAPGEGYEAAGVSRCFVPVEPAMMGGSADGDVGPAAMMMPPSLAVARLVNDGPKGRAT